MTLLGSGEPEDDPGSDPNPRPGRWWRAAVLAAGTALTLLLGSVVLSLIPALGSVRHLRDGRAALAEARSALLDAQVGAASDAFERAHRAFIEASANANEILTDLPSMVPLLGRTYDALRTLADAGREISAAGQEVAGSVGALPGGPSALGPSHGRLPLDVYERLVPVVHRARATLEVADRRIAAIATSMVPTQVVEARDAARAAVEDALPSARSAEELLRWLPAFAGRDGPRSYFLAAQNPAELRGTGGLITMYSILTLDRGRTRIEPFRDPPRLERVDPADGVWPSAQSKEAFASFDSATVLHNTNVTPDVPTAAELLLNVWKRTEEPSLDGVIFVDTQTIRYLLEPLGRIHVDGVDGPLTPHNVVPFMTSRAYELYPDRAQRKRLLGSVGTTTFERFFDDAHGLPALQAVADAASAGLVSVYAVDPEVESALRRSGLGGHLEATGGPLFGTFVANIGGNKLDYYLRTNLAYELRLQPDGSALARASLELRNGSPRNAPPGEVFGPNRTRWLAGMDLKVGETYLQTLFYCGGGCSVLSATIDGEPLPLHQYEQGALRLYSTSLRILPRASRTITLSLSIDRGWREEAGGGTTSLRVLAQPMLNPMDAQVTIQAPEGRPIRQTDPRGTASGSRATWELDPAPSRDLRVGF